MRSVAVLGHSLESFRGSPERRLFVVFENTWIAEVAAPEDGRTPQKLLPPVLL